MKVNIEKTYEAMSNRAAVELLSLLQTFDKPLISVASGASTAEMYRGLVNLVKETAVDTSAWHFVGLDEWMGMDGSVEGSCRNQLDQQLFYPLKIPQDRICFFNGKAEDTESECKKVETFIQLFAQMNVAILGIGINGHIGMNEPGTSAALRSHVAAIHPSTQQIGQRFFKEPCQLDKGLTLGITTLLEADHIMLLASGDSKEKALYGMMNEPQSEAMPATLIRDHKNLMLYLEKDAAALISPRY